jgi:hypothetical protein
VNEVAESLAILVLPCRLEEFELADHARELLAIPRVVALEPRRMRPSGLFGEAAAVRQARRLRLPGEPRIVVLYHAGEYPLARALCARYEQAELWYVRPEPASPASRGEFDVLACERASRVVGTDTQVLRRRLIDLDVINPRPFAPGARISRR